MRQVCNLSFFFQVDTAPTTEDVRAFELELPLDPDDNRKVSKGVGALMGLMGGAPGGR